MDESRYMVTFGPNTKQFWILDGKNGTYIDPPLDVLDKMDELRFKDGKETADSVDAAVSWLEDLINAKEPDWLHDGNEYDADSMDP